MSVPSSATAASLTGIAALHLGWAAGASFPFPSRELLADAVAGSTSVPEARECIAVGGLLLTAAGLVGDVLPVGKGVRRLGVVGFALVLGVRGALGITGRTSMIVPWTPSARFNELDRKYYGPLSLGLACGAVLSLKSHSSSTPGTAIICR